jgi:hypothetical protein
LSWREQHLRQSIADRIFNFFLWIEFHRKDLLREAT